MPDVDGMEIVVVRFGEKKAKPKFTITQRIDDIIRTRDRHGP
jgi:hypothetical protein